jgi:hypothetical protein
MPENTSEKRQRYARLRVRIAQLRREFQEVGNDKKRRVEITLDVQALQSELNNIADEIDEQKVDLFERLFDQLAVDERAEVRAHGRSGWVATTQRLFSDVASLFRNIRRGAERAVGRRTVPVLLVLIVGVVLGASQLPRFFPGGLLATSPSPVTLASPVVPTLLPTPSPVTQPTAADTVVPTELPPSATSSATPRATSTPDITPTSTDAAATMTPIPATLTRPTVTPIDIAELQTQTALSLQIPTARPTTPPTPVPTAIPTPINTPTFPRGRIRDREVNIPLYQASTGTATSGFVDDFRGLELYLCQQVGTRWAVDVPSASTPCRMPRGWIAVIAIEQLP